MEKYNPLNYWPFTRERKFVPIVNLYKQDGYWSTVVDLTDAIIRYNPELASVFNGIVAAQEGSFYERRSVEPFVVQVGFQEKPELKTHHGPCSILYHDWLNFCRQENDYWPKPATISQLHLIENQGKYRLQHRVIVLPVMDMCHFLNTAITRPRGFGSAYMIRPGLSL